MNALTRRPLPHMTSDDFLAWPGDGRVGKAQLIDGQVYVMPPASAVHGAIHYNLSGLLRGVVPSRLQYCNETAIRPRVEGSMNVRVPDLLGTNEPLVRDMQTVEHPVLIVEILSPGNTDTTRENMMAYATMPSVQELIVVHSTRVLAEILHRSADGSWPADPAYVGPGEALTIASAGLTCPMEALYAGTWLAQ